MFTWVETACAVLSRLVAPDSLWPYVLHPTRLLCSEDSPGRNTGMGCHALIQGIFLTQGSNSCLVHLLHWQAGSLPLSATSLKTTHLLWIVVQDQLYFQSLLCSVIWICSSCVPPSVRCGIHTVVYSMVFKSFVMLFKIKSIHEWPRGESQSS